MESQHYTNRAGWTIIMYGVSLSFIAAFTPMFVMGYVFKGDVFLAGLFPYLIYALAVPLLPGAITTTVGMLLATVHSGLVAAVRFLSFNDSLIYIIPIIMAVLLIPLVVIAVYKTDVHKPGQRIVRH